MANGANGGDQHRLSLWGTFWLVAGAGVLIYLCWARTTNNGLTIDGTTLVYIAVAVLFLILPAIVPLVKSVTIGKDSVTVTLDRLEKEVQQTRKIAESAKSAADESARILRNVAPRLGEAESPPAP